MDFAEQIKELAAQLEKNMDHVFTEEATKVSMVMPFLQVMGYNVFDPTEVIPEFTADVGFKKGEKVDYAIRIDKDPMILIEVKPARSQLRPDQSFFDQLYRYFSTTKKSKLAILTNGIQYKFYSDLDEPNIMDREPFLIIDLVPSIYDSEILELKKFHKEKFNHVEILSSARDLKYTGEIKRIIKQQVKSPEDDFIRFLINKTSFKGKGFITEKIVDQFRPIVKNAFDHYLREITGDKLNVAWEITKVIEPEKELRPKDELRLRFWTQLTGYAKTKTNLHSNVTPGTGGWIATGAGMGGLGYSYNIGKHQGIVSFYIDRGEKKKGENDIIYNRLIENKNEIEKSFGGPLEWDRPEGVRYRRIKKTITDGGYLDEQNWPKVYESMVEAMIALEKAINPYIRNIKEVLE